MTRRRALGASLVPLAALLCTLAWRSLGWRMSHDPPLFLYQGFLMDRLGLVPYRDFWDNNPPGTQLVNWAVVHFVGWSDAALRLADLALLAVTLTATGLALRAIDRLAAVFAVLLWGLVYVGLGPGFQRDDLVTLGVSVCLALTLPAWPRPATRWLALGVGLVLGAVATIKPPALIALPAFAAALAGRDSEAPGAGRLWRSVALLGWSALGAAVPISATLGYLWRHDALLPFLEVVERDWPLYTRLSGGLATIQSPLFNLYSGYRKFGLLELWLIPALVGLATGLAAFRGDAQRRRALGLLLGLAVSLLAYVGIQGKFFAYHWNPFHYCLVLLASLSFADPPRPRGLRWLAPLAVVGFVLWRMPLLLDFGDEVARRYTAPPKGGRVDEISDFLRARLRPGDTVQPLDWTGGALHAMLIAGAVPATPFLYDYVFYHHVSENWIADLRGRFLESIRRARPRFVVEVDAPDKPYVRGKDTTRDFNKLRRFLAENYRVVERRNGYVIYERSGVAAAPPEPEG